MLIDSALFSRGSGSLGGLTLSHNAGGLYLRARTLPTNPNTQPQQDVRAAAASLVNRWTNVLASAQRDLWNSYAFATPLTGPLGNARTVSGQNMYVRGNVSRAIQGMPLADDAPVVFNLGSFTLLTDFAANTTLQQVGFEFTNTDLWANEDDAALLVFVSRPQNLTINYFNGPYQFGGKIDGDGVTPPTSPAAIASPFTFVDGQRMYVRCVVTRVDGRLSNQQVLNATALGV